MSDEASNRDEYVWLDDWDDVLRASMDTALAFLADEPELYTDEDGEAVD